MRRQDRGTHKKKQLTKLTVIQGEDMKRNPEMDKSAVWAGTGCMAVSPISGLRFISSPCRCFTVRTKLLLMRNPPHRTGWPLWSRRTAQGRGLSITSPPIISLILPSGSVASPHCLPQLPRVWRALVQLVKMRLTHEITLKIIFGHK